jgi:hypothetical protein
MALKSKGKEEDLNLTILSILAGEFWKWKTRIWKKFRLLLSLRTPLWFLSTRKTKWSLNFWSQNSSQRSQTAECIFKVKNMSLNSLYRWKVKLKLQQ